MSQFDRVAKIVVDLRSEDFTHYIGQVEIQNLRIAFNINKNLSWSTNKGSVQIWNLSKEKRAAIKDYGDQVTIFAGYRFDTGLNLLYVGDTTSVTHIFDQPEIISNFVSGDGEKILNQKLIQVSYGAGASVKEVLRELARQMGFTNELELDNLTDLKYINKFVFDGIGKDGLDKVTTYLGATWSVQNGKLQIVKNDVGTLKPPVEISENTGMIGVPQRYTSKRRDLYRDGPRQGYKVKSLLRPDIIPGDRVRLISAKIDVDEVGYVYSVTHVGDTHGQPWYSDFELIRL